MIIIFFNKTNKTKQNKTKQNKTKQNKTKQKYFVFHSHSTGKILSFHSTGARGISFKLSFIKV